MTTRHPPPATASQMLASSLLGLAGFLVCGNAAAVSAYAGAFDGPAGTQGTEDSGVSFAHATRHVDTEHQGMDAEATASAGELRGYAFAFNDTGSFQFATAVAKFEDSFTLTPHDGINEAVVTFVLSLKGGCVGSPGSTNGRPNATCYGGASLNAGSPYEMSLDHAGELSRTFTLMIANGFGNLNGYPIAPFLQVGGYATNGDFFANFRDTAHIYAYSSTPGVSLVSASGFDYSPPLAVPEPATVALLLFGLALGLRHPTVRSAMRREKSRAIG